jgi:hypothetical protein
MEQKVLVLNMYPSECEWGDPVNQIASMKWWMREVQSKGLALQHIWEILPLIEKFMIGSGKLNLKEKITLVSTLGIGGLQDLCIPWGRLYNPKYTHDRFDAEVDAIRDFIQATLDLLTKGSRNTGQTDPRFFFAPLEE